MASLLLFATIGGCLWVYSSNTFMSRELLRSYALIMLGVSVLVWLFFALTLNPSADAKPLYVYLAFIPFFALTTFYISKRIRQRGLKIVANQQRYWDEVTSEDVSEFYKYRKILKGGRFATKVNIEDRRLFKNIIISGDGDGENTKIKEIISPSFFKNLKRLDSELTKIDDLGQLEQYPLYAAIFKKLKEIIKKSEKTVDYESELKNSFYVAEYFLMRLWENHTKRTNISNANLAVLASRDIENELIGALDNLDLNCVKKRGAALYYRYMRFCGRDEAYISKPASDETASEDGEILI